MTRSRTSRQLQVSDEKDSTFNKLVNFAFESGMRQYHRIQWKTLMIILG